MPRIRLSRAIAFLCCLPVLSQDAPKLRLDGNFRPLEYAAKLRITPDQDRFSGEIEITLNSTKPAATIWLNADQDLKIEHASLDGRAGKVLPGGKDFQGIAFPQPVSAGKLQIRYSAPVDRKSSSGVFQVKDGDHWYVYTQFEPISGRRAFPCFDEPSYKVPWQLTLEIPKDQQAFSNSPALSETASETTKTLRFGRTRPMPSYLVAFAVGPFEAVSARASGMRKTPVRIIVPKGRTAEAEYAARVTPEVLEELEKFFGIPYPYGKLDSIAVPLFAGAMENAGLITYNLPMILSKPSEDSIQRQRLYTRIAVHEIGHQWFGNLVTTRWWDDIWLNEAFASWIEDRVLSAWKPDWGSAESSVSSRLFSMGQDSLVSARRIRQPIASNDDIANAFDGITYQKGAAIIRMFEAYAGPENFRRGIKSYLDQYADRNADVTNFLEAVGRGAGKEITQPFSTFLEQAGVPVVSMELKCEQGQPPTVMLSQKRLLPQGSQGSAQQTWRVPVCIGYEADGKTQRECTLLSGATASWTLTQTKSCPAWISGNADASGYYHVRYEGGLLDKIMADGGRRLTPAERMSAVGDVNALVTAGELPAATALALVPQFSRDRNRFIVQQLVSLVKGIRAHLVPAALVPNYSRFVTKAFGDRAIAIGWKEKTGEDNDTRLLRPQLLRLVTAEGNVPALRDEARKMARAWLKDRGAVSEDVVESLLFAAANVGDEALFTEYVAAAQASKEEKERGRLLRALGHFRDPAIARRALSLVLSPNFDVRQSLYTVFGMLEVPATAELPYAFVRENYDAIIERLGNAEGVFDLGAFLPRAATGLCSKERIPEVREFFAERSKRRTGGERMLAQALEMISLCDARVKAQQEAVTSFLSQY